MAETQTVVIERVFDAPREKVWAAWSEPEQFMKWWGPKGFTAPEAKIDFREGGTYFNCMQSPDGKKYYGTGTYEEIVPLEKIVYTDSFADEQGNIVPGSYYEMPGEFPLKMRVTVFFEDQDGKTKMTLRHEGHPAGEMGEQAKAGWSESFDKLAESLQ